MATKTKKVVEEAVEEKATEEKAKAKKESLMAKIVNDSITPPNIGDIMEGNVIGVERSAVYIDLGQIGTGLIYGREFINARDIIKKINIGDSISAKVVDTNNSI
jgi:small subunit ribosomal protein S1